MPAVLLITLFLVLGGLMAILIRLWRAAAGRNNEEDEDRAPDPAQIVDIYPPL